MIKIAFEKTQHPFLIFKKHTSVRGIDLNIIKHIYLNLKVIFMLKGKL